MLACMRKSTSFHILANRNQSLVICTSSPLSKNSNGRYPGHENVKLCDADVPLVSLAITNTSILSSAHFHKEGKLSIRLKTLIIKTEKFRAICKSWQLTIFFSQGHITFLAQTLNTGPSQWHELSRLMISAPGWRHISLMSPFSCSARHSTRLISSPWHTLPLMGQLL